MQSEMQMGKKIPVDTSKVRIKVHTSLPLAKTEFETYNMSNLHKRFCEGYSSPKAKSCWDLKCVYFKRFL